MVGGVEVGIGVKFDRVRGEVSKFLMIITPTQSLRVTYTNPDDIALDTY